jgi:serine/threonine protein kinase
MTLLAGARLGPYEVLDAIGAGGMGEVYKARDTRLDRAVAIKVLPADFAADAERLTRFEREAKATAALSHPNILAIHDTGTQDGVPYLVEELLEGESLKDRLGGGAIPVRKAVGIAVQIAHGLAAAHERHIVHRDLKPANVFLTRDGTVKILDFGLAKLVEEVPPEGAETVTAKPARDRAGQLRAAPHGTDCDHQRSLRRHFSRRDQRKTAVGSLGYAKAGQGSHPLRRGARPAAGQHPQEADARLPGPVPRPGAVRRVLLRSGHPEHGREVSLEPADRRARYSTMSE